MKKNTTKFIAALLALLFICIAGMSAYLWELEEVEDCYTIGRIEVEMTGSNNDYVGELLTPRYEYEYRRAVHNIGTNDAYVYMTITIPYKTASIYNQDGYPIEQNGSTVGNVQLFSYGYNGMAGVNPDWELVTAGKFGNYGIVKIDDVLLSASDTYASVDNFKENVTYVYAYTGGTGNLMRLSADETTPDLFDTLKMADTNKNVELGEGDIKIGVYAIQADNFKETTYMEGRNDDGVNDVNSGASTYNLKNTKASGVGVNIGWRALEPMTPKYKKCTLYTGQTFNSNIISAAGGDASTITKITFGYYNIPKGKTIYSVGSNVVCWNDNGHLYITTKGENDIIIANTNCSYMFKELTGLTSVDVSPVFFNNTTNVRDMFYNCRSLSEINFGDINTEKVTNMHQMFAGCSSLKAIDVSCLDTDSVTDMSRMFRNCSSLTKIDISTFNTSKVTTMALLFNGCSNLQTINLDNIDTSNVKTMNSMFYSCNKLRNLDVSKFNTESLEDVSWMFYVCPVTKDVGVHTWNTKNLKNTSHMFYACHNLFELDLSGWVTTNLTTTEGMFCGCKNLKTIYANDWSDAPINNGATMFKDCHVLRGAVSYRSSQIGPDMANTTTGYFTAKNN